MVNILNEFNGISFFSESKWPESTFIDLTDPSGNRNFGCCCYFNGERCVFEWPDNWDIDLFYDITYLVLVPIVLAFHLKAANMKIKTCLFRSDN